MKISVIIGIAAIAGIAYYLSTPEGKVFVKKICGNAKDLQDDATAFAEDIIEKGKDLFGKAKDAAGDVATS